MGCDHPHAGRDRLNVGTLIMANEEAKVLAQATKGATVTVACKLPNGHVLRLSEMVSRREPMMGGGYQEVKRASWLPDRYVLRGTASLQGVALPYPLIGGYALTPGIPAEFWDRWKEQYADSDLLKNNVIFAHSRQDHIQDWAKEHKSQKSGLERIDPEHPPQVSGRMKIEKANLGDEAA